MFFCLCSLLSWFSGVGLVWVFWLGLRWDNSVPFYPYLVRKCTTFYLPFVPCKPAKTLALTLPFVRILGRFNPYIILYILRVECTPV